MAAQIAIVSSTCPIADRIYLDHAATTPLRPEAKAALEEGFRLWANPSSPHAEGRKARALLEDARERIKAALGWDGELIFTSGASEAAALAIAHANASGRLISSMEHDAIQRAAPDWQWLESTQHSGEVHRDEVAVAMGRHPGALVAIQTVNSETGNAQDIPALAREVHNGGGLLLSDASQSVGKFELPDGPDMVIVSAHKFGGPIGVGALLVKDFAMLRPTGGHERGYRRGTENLPGAMGMSTALEACDDPYLADDVLMPLLELSSALRNIEGAHRLSNGLKHPTPYIETLAMPLLSGSAQVMRFDMAGIAVSQGSACSSGTMKRSQVLNAMQIDPSIADRTIRVSFGWNTTRAEVERFCEVWLDMARGT